MSNGAQQEIEALLAAAERGEPPAPTLWLEPILDLADYGGIAELAPRLRRALDAAAEAAPDSPAVYVARGELLRALGRLAGAADEFAYAGELDEEHQTDAWRRLAEVEAERERWDEVASALDRALDADPDDADLCAAYGDALLEAGEPTRAIAAFEEGLEVSASDCRLLMGRARASRELELWEDVAEDCRHVLRLEPERSDARLLLAQALFFDAQDVAAMEALEPLLGGSPESAEVLRLQGDIRWSLGETELAAEAYLAALAIEDDPETRLAHAECLLDQGDAEGALAQARTVLEADPEAIDALAVIARAEDAAGRPDDATAALEQGIELDHDAPEPYLARAEHHLARGLLNLAWRDARWAIERDEELTGAYVLRGSLALVLESPEEALGDLEAALELDPDFGPAYAWRGRAHALAGRASQAAADWTEAERLLPEGDPLREEIKAWRSNRTPTGA